MSRCARCASWFRFVLGNLLLCVAGHSADDRAPATQAGTIRIFRSFAQFLVWPPVVVHRLVNAGDHSLALGYFGLPADLFVSASDVVMSIFAMSVAISMSLLGSPSTSLAVRILVAVCLVHVTAR